MPSLSVRIICFLSSCDLLYQKENDKVSIFSLRDGTKVFPYPEIDESKWWSKLDKADKHEFKLAKAEHAKMRIKQLNESKQSNDDRICVWWQGDPKRKSIVSGFKFAELAIYESAALKRVKVKKSNLTRLREFLMTGKDEKFQEILEKDFG